MSSLTRLDTLTILQVSHAFLQRDEPRPLPFLGFMSAFNASVFCYAYMDTRALIYSLIVSTTVVNAFLLGLSSSIVLYRLSPWHPLARYPGPTLGKVSKWYMSFWIAKGTRHTKLHE